MAPDHMPPANVRPSGEIATAGEIWRLDPETGGLQWHNKMRGLGQGLVSLASTQVAGSSDSSIEYHRRAAAAAAAAATG